MHLSTAFITYIFTVLLCLVLPMAVGVIASKRKLKISILHICFGALMFVVALIGFYLVLRYHLNAQDGITDYYNTATYRVTIVILLALLLSVFIWIFAMFVYSRRQAFEQCLSFFVGFGCGGCLMLGVYALIMLIGLTYQSLSSTLLTFDTTVQAFYFSPDTYFTVFTPMLGHISFSVAFLCFWCICVAYGLIISRMGIKKVAFIKSLLAFVGISISFSALILMLFFMSMFNMPHYIMAMVAIVCAILSLVMVLVIYKHKQTEHKGYTRQFD